MLADDRAAVAALASYPFRVTIGGERRAIVDASTFAESYPILVTERVKAAVAGATPDNLFANSQGVRIGRGEPWFSGVYPEGSQRYVLMILTINSD